jgi:hypothetical protein
MSEKARDRAREGRRQRHMRETKERDRHMRETKERDRDRREAQISVFFS